MERYIKTDIIAKIVFDKWKECEKIERIIPEIRRAIMYESTTDVVEVVRCKYCKYGHELTDENGYRFILCNYPTGHGLLVCDYDFCKWGERGTDDAEK